MILKKIVIAAVIVVIFIWVALTYFLAPTKADGKEELEVCFKPETVYVKVAKDYVIMVIQDCDGIEREFDFALDDLADAIYLLEDKENATGK